MEEDLLYKLKIFKAKNHSRGNIFFVGPFTGKEIYFRPLINQLKDRYTLHYIQPKDESLSYGNPENLALVIKQVGDYIKLNQKKTSGFLNFIKLKLGKLKNKNFVVGTSLGSYIGYFSIPDLNFVDKYFFNASGGLISHIYEDADFKKTMQYKKFSNEQIAKAIKIWSDYENENVVNIKLKGKSIKVVNSNYDKLIQKKHTKEWFGSADLSGSDLSFEYTNLPGHQAQVLALNLYAKKITEFFS
jgi:hypothetical protein